MDWFATAPDTPPMLQKMRDAVTKTTKPWGPLAVAITVLEHREREAISSGRLDLAVEIAADRQRCTTVRQLWP